jgi:hypothetical protein
MSQAASGIDKPLWSTPISLTRLVDGPDVPSSARVKLNIGAVYRDAALTYRTRATRVIGTAVIILVPITALQVVVADVGRHGEPHPTWAAVLYVAALIDLAAVGTFASTFYAGVVDRTVLADRGEGPERGMAQIFRELPYWRLIRADLLYLVLAAIGTLLLVVPGLIVATVFSIVGPVMLIEDRAVLDTFRRSYRLVRPHFWRVVVTTLVPLVVASTIADRLLTVSAHPSLALELVVECLFAALVSSFVGLLEVHTAYQLIQLDQKRPARPGPG